MVVLKTQELAGLDVIADGELTRFDINHPETNGMIEYFIRPLGGVDSALGRREIADFRAQQGMGFRTQPAGVVHGPIDEGTLNLPTAWSMVKPLTTSAAKFTVTAPYSWRKRCWIGTTATVKPSAWRSPTCSAKQVADIDASVLQLDEANLTGHPEDAEWAHEPLNHVLDAANGERALHLCFGNYGGQSIQRGFWRDLLPFLNALHVDHLVLEFARRGYDELTCSATCARRSRWASASSTSKTTRSKRPTSSRNASSTP